MAMEYDDDKNMCKECGVLFMHVSVSRGFDTCHRVRMWKWPALLKAFQKV